MVQVVKEICIFMLITQAILFFVPGGAYMKYVRILAGVLVILKVTEPFVHFFADKKTELEIQGRMEELFTNLGKTQQLPDIEDAGMGIYYGIEEELKRKLSQCENDYIVKRVALDGEEGVVIVTVQPRNKAQQGNDIGEIWIEPIILGSRQEEECEQENGEENEDFEKLKKQYGDCIGAEPENILVKQAGGVARR